MTDYGENSSSYDKCRLMGCWGIHFLFSWSDLCWL